MLDLQQVIHTGMTSIFKRSQMIEYVMMVPSMIDQTYLGNMSKNSNNRKLHRASGQLFKTILWQQMDPARKKVCKCL